MGEAVGHAWEKSAPCESSKWLARMRSIGPVFGTAWLSVLRRASFPNETSACSGEMSFAARAVPCVRSRHQAAFVIAFMPSVGFCVGSFVRNAPLKNAAGEDVVPAPPGCDESALPWGSRYFLADASHSPTPAHSRAERRFGFHCLCATRTSICLRLRETLTFGAFPLTFLPELARVSSATSFFPLGWTVRNRSAGAFTFVPNGNSCGVPFLPPIPIEKATRDGSFSVFSVTRKAVAVESGLTRSSTKSAALFAYALLVGYVYVPFCFEKRFPAVRGSFGSLVRCAPLSS